jgi:hypothetical protein
MTNKAISPLRQCEDVAHHRRLLRSGRGRPPRPCRCRRCCRRFADSEGFSVSVISGLSRGFSTCCLCHQPCKTRFRLAGLPLPGGSRTLWIGKVSDHILIPSPFLDLSWRYRDELSPPHASSLRPPHRHPIPVKSEWEMRPSPVQVPCRHEQELPDIFDVSPHIRTAPQLPAHQRGCYGPWRKGSVVAIGYSIQKPPRHPQTVSDADRVRAQVRFRAVPSTALFLGR